MCLVMLSTNHLHLIFFFFFTSSNFPSSLPFSLFAQPSFETHPNHTHIIIQDGLCCWLNWWY